MARSVKDAEIRFKVEEHVRTLLQQMADSDGEESVGALVRKMVYDSLSSRLVTRAHIVDSHRLEKLLQALNGDK